MIYGIDKKTKLPYLLAHFNDTFYKLYAESDCVKIQYYSDKSTDTYSHIYEVAILYPVSKNAAETGHLDMLVVLNEDKHVVAYSDEVAWIDAFIHNEDYPGYLEVYEKMFKDIITQIHMEDVKHVGQ